MADLGPQTGFQDALRAHGEAKWRDALLALQILAAGGMGMGGLWIKARSSGVRDIYLDHLRNIMGQGTAWTRLPANTSLSGLLGSVDLAASATSGKLVKRPGILQTSGGGILMIPMAERLDHACAAVIASALDLAGRAGFIIIAIDESVEDEETLPSPLADRLGLRVDLDSVPWSVASRPEHLEGKRTSASLSSANLKDDVFTLLSNIAVATGNVSLRSLTHLTRASRLLAALEKRPTVNETDGLTALRLCLGIQLAAPESDEREAQTQEEPQRQEPPEPTADSPQPPSDADEQSSGDDHDTPMTLDQLTELLAAVETGSIGGIPAFISGDKFQRSKGKAGKAGSMQKDVRRGRPFGIAQSPPYPDARPDVIATLRAAAPWQKIRRAQRERLETRGEDTQQVTACRPRLLITRDDYRYQRLRHQAPSTAVFMVDASGSTALERLGETKGAIEQLLARCYVRRDEVALIAFRGKSAETVLPPTRSLVAAKRKLSGLPGGGPTPLVSGLERGLEIALSLRRQGSTPILVLLTDGSGNIALDGTPDRPLAAEQLSIMARKYRSLGLKSICIDIARRPREAVTKLAAEMGADLHVLPRADARRMSDLVNASMEENRS